MVQALPTYLPHDRLQALACGATLPDQATGTVLFADISGFTPLTEALTRTLGSRRGAEQLAQTIGQVYDLLIAQIETWYGSVITFSGDAITCWFDDADGSPAPRAAAAALAMQQAMRSVAAVPVADGAAVQLALKISLVSGPARRFAVGDPALRLFDVLAGATLTRVAAVEQLARPGDVLLDESTVAALGPLALLGESATGSDGVFRVVRLTGLRCPVAPQPRRELCDGELRPETLRPWVLPAVTERELAGLGAFLTELRPVVPMFVRFAGIDYDSDPDAQARLDSLVCAAQHILARYNGTLLELTIGDKGSSIYAAFGAPVAHEDDAYRAALAALDLQQAAQKLPWLEPLQIGISQGVLRVGASGSASRRTYVATGDAVNLAARLMIAAVPGEILISRHVRLPAGNPLALEPRPPMRLKGKAEPEPIWVVHGPRYRRAMRLEEPLYDTPMIGRTGELALIQSALQEVLAGQGQIVALVAEAGMGKSRLLAEAIHIAQQRGMIGYGGACQATGTTSPYLIWGPIWQAFFDIDPNTPSRRQIRQLLGAVEDLAPKRLDAAPLLGPLLGISLPDNDFTRTLEPHDRKNALHALLREALASSAREAAADGRGLLLVLEDLHWIDAVSHELLVDLAQMIRGLPVLMLLAYRPPDTRRLQAPQLEALPHCRRIALGPLDETDTEQLIRAKLSQLFPARRGTMPADLIRRLGSRAQGNPFYLEELLNYLHDRAIDPYDSAALATLELPDSLHRLILSRLDQLSTQQQALLKSASVIGRRFLVAWLAGAFTAHATERLPDNLRALEYADLTTLDGSAPEQAYLFKHVVTQECAYTSLSEVTRRMLHEQIAVYLESLPDEAPERLVDLLAYHYDRTANLPKRRFYLRRAGEAAAARFAHDAALDYFTRALALAPEDALTERYELLLAREALLDRRGDRAAQLHDLEALTALAHALQDDARRSLILTRRANYALVTSDYPVAIEAVAHAAQQAEACGATAVLIQAHRLWGRALHEQGHYHAAREHFQRSMELAQASGDRRGETQALDGLGVVAVQTDDYAGARAYHEASLQIARATGDRVAECAALNQLGQSARYQGDYPTARAYFEQSLQIVQSIGDRRLEANILCRIGIMVYNIEDFDLAHTYYTQSLQIAQAIGDRQAECFALCNFGLLASHLEDLDKALIYYERSLAICRIIGDRHSEAAILNNLGSILSGQYCHPEAREYYEQSLQVVRATNNLRLEALTLSNLGDIATIQGDFADAYSYLQKGHDITQAIGNRPFECFALTFLGNLALQVGNFNASIQYYEKLLQLSRELRSRNFELSAIFSLGNAATAQGQIAQALSYYRQSLSMLQELSDRALEIKVPLGYGFALLEAGSYDEAESIFRQVLSRCHVLKQLSYLPAIEVGLAQIALSRSDLPAALEHATRALSKLEQRRLDGIEAPLRVLLICYEVLVRAGHERAGEILALSHSELQRRALTLPDGAARRMFSEEVVVNRRILQYAGQLQDVPHDSMVSV